ncbi:hypothetical protein [Protaetiibacter larvae]|uniref:Phage tail protein n=1 Tax=Protaetiibacter larvae TaxID=2592654 RepID=A0A5C1Y6P6_9MICO|nr:hypothetical protein [Protaetiibacter larvae]QEO08885.1 hypothetical protein FLP23_01920 [Protaetiibacter larvae]
MATTLSSGGDTLTATLHLGYTATRRGRTVMHEILGTNELAVTGRPAGLRSGRRELLFRDDEVAVAAVEMLSGGGIVTLADTDRPVFNMTFVAAAVELELTNTRRSWIVRFDFQELAP